ncbi:MAG: hypothetical protein OHK0021_23950 [Bryobacter sp.]|nr:hypothetical protein [Bryobacter sp.]
MSVLVRIGRKKAILCEAMWKAADLELETQLQHATEIWIQKTGGPPLSHKDPDLFAAEALKPELGFEIAAKTPPKGKAARRAYLAKRQIRLPFYD